MGKTKSRGNGQDFKEKLDLLLEEPMTDADISQLWRLRAKLGDTLTVGNALRVLVRVHQAGKTRAAQ